MFSLFYISSSNNAQLEVLGVVELDIRLAAVFNQTGHRVESLDISVGEPDLFLVGVHDALDGLDGFVGEVVLWAQRLKDHNTESLLHDVDDSLLGPLPDS